MAAFLEHIKAEIVAQHGQVCCLQIFIKHALNIKYLTRTMSHVPLPLKCGAVPLLVGCTLMQPHAAPDLEPEACTLTYDSKQ